MLASSCISVFPGTSTAHLKCLQVRRDQDIHIPFHCQQASHFTPITWLSSCQCVGMTAAAEEYVFAKSVAVYRWYSESVSCLLDGAVPVCTLRTPYRAIPVKQIRVCRCGLSMFWGSVQMEEVTVIWPNDFFYGLVRVHRLSVLLCVWRHSRLDWPGYSLQEGLPLSNNCIWTFKLWSHYCCIMLTSHDFF